MKEKNEFYVISKSVLPEVFIKVMEVKELLEVEKLLTVQEATERVGISRSSFYKYKDAIMPFYEKGNDQVITILIHLKDRSGTLSHLLNYIAATRANVMTINQMIPMNGIAIINMCIETSHIKMEISELLTEIEAIEAIKMLSY